MTTSTKTSAASISRFLSAQGFKKNVEATSMVRGYHISSGGFVATNSGAGVLVEVIYTRYAADINQLDRIYAVLTAKGYEVNVRGTSKLRLFVTKEGN